MSENLVELPDRQKHPFRNMEEDLLLLYRNPYPSSIIFRHYNWRVPCWTCGYSQKFSEVKEVTGGNESTIFRRATGGGIVPHWKDWTFTLIVGPKHQAFTNHPRNFYDMVHKAILDVLADLGETATLHECEQDVCNGAPLTECFQSPVLSDVLNAKTGAKLAGAAIKKTKEGLLLQGSVQKADLPRIDWITFKAQLTKKLTISFNSKAEKKEWPFTSEDHYLPYGERIHCEAWLNA